MVLENDWVEIFYIGIAWNKEIVESLKNDGGIKEIITIKESKLKLLEDIMKESKSHDTINQEIKKSIKNIEKLPKAILDNLLDYAQKTEQNLVDGKTFISDEDASYLGVDNARIIIELKMRIISMITPSLVIVLTAISNPEEFEAKEHADSIKDLVWAAIIVSKHIDTLSNAVDYFIDKSVFNLTVANLFRRYP